MTTAIYYAWVTAASPHFAELLCSKLIRRGFTVGPLGRQLVTEYEDVSSVVVAMSLQRIPRTDEEEKEYTPHGVYSEIVDVIKFIKGKYWSLVVSQSAPSTWSVGNVRESSEEKKRADEAKKIN